MRHSHRPRAQAASHEFPKAAQMPDTPRNHFLRMKEVRQRTGLSTSTIYRKIQEGTFPPGHSLGAKARRWLDSEVQSWIEAQLASAPEIEPWRPPLPPARRVGEKKPPPLVPNEKGAEAAAKVAGVVGLAVPDGEVPCDREIALRFPDWPEMMRQRTAAANSGRLSRLVRVRVHSRSVSRRSAQPGPARWAAELEPPAIGQGARPIAGRLAAPASNPPHPSGWRRIDSDQQL
ncbi:helix-turn-helix transcriptional regulator [Sphingomonas sp. Sphisp140]|uniref:helix-turn-helix transcriptional regulator n=1 Tax=unclassified Sphingomonas TaxID=196159 RepID=UPI0039AF3E96